MIIDMRERLIEIVLNDLSTDKEKVGMYLTISKWEDYKIIRFINTYRKGWYHEARDNT